MVPAVGSQARESGELFVQRQQHQHNEASKEEIDENLLPPLKEVGAKDKLVVKPQKLQPPVGICKSETESAAREDARQRGRTEQAPRRFAVRTQLVSHKNLLYVYHFRT